MTELNRRQFLEGTAALAASAAATTEAQLAAEDTPKSPPLKSDFASAWSR